ncbi:MAG: hypothetical protein IJJ25_01460 [Lachnospiraceae bacterium]|nr:hypothetical protein [Lachnospiraceae bacterium]
MENRGFVGIPPMYREQYMAHALGGYRGYQLLATEEAFRNSYQCGFRYFEVDLKATADDQLVCTYGWSRQVCERIGMPYDPAFENMTHELFMKQKIHGMPVMDAARLIALMEEFPDTYMEIDLHTLDQERAVYMTRLLAEQFCEKAGLADRLLIQVNTEEMYFAVDSVYHFPYYQFNVREEADKTDHFIAFCREHGICAMALKGKFADEERVRKIKDAGLELLVFTIDSPSRCREYLRRGASTICTNYVIPGARDGQQDSVIRLGYSSRGHAKEGYSALVEKNILRGVTDRMPDGSFEYTEAVDTLRNRFYPLADCQFTRSFGRKPSGWILRAKKGNQKNWRYFCTDGKWHLQGGIDKKGLTKKIFPNVSTIDFEKIFYAGVMIFEAIW